jgi:hypothetical protein
LNQAVSRVLFGEGLFMGEMFRTAREASSKMSTGMIQQAAARGNINPKIDPSVAAFVVETLLNSLGMFILSQHPVSQEDLRQGDIRWLSSERARQIIDSMLLVMKQGLRNQGSDTGDTQ